MSEAKFTRSSQWVRSTVPEAEPGQEELIRQDEDRPPYRGRRPGAVARSPFAPSNPKEDR